MDVSLTTEQEKVVNEALRSGRYRDATEVLDDALHGLETRLCPERVTDVDRQQAIERLRTFGQRHGLSLGRDLTVKELIDEGRR